MSATTRTALQLVRIPVLVGLLFALEPAYAPLMRAVQRLDQDAFWLPWTWLMAVGAVFCVLMLSARGGRPSRGWCWPSKRSWPPSSP